MSGEATAVTTHQSPLQVKLRWTVNGWRSSKGYAESDGGIKCSSIASPEFKCAGDSTWTLAIVFPEAENIYARKVYFQCDCQQKPKIGNDESIGFKGSLTVSNNTGGQLREQCIHDVKLLPSTAVFRTSLESSSYFSDDLIITVDISVSGWTGVTKQPDPKSYRRTVDSSLAPFLSQLASDEDFADVVIEVDRQRVLAHRAVLAARSSVLRAMLLSDMEEKREAKIVMSDISFAAWRIFQTFLYTDNFAPPENCGVDLLIEILMLSDKYDVQAIRTRAEDAILDRTTRENVLEILEAVENFEVPVLRAAASEIIIRNWETLKEKKRMMTWMASGCDLATTIIKRLHL